MSSSIFNFNSTNEASMLRMGSSLAMACQDQAHTMQSQPMVIYLRGPLGAGKTTLVRGFLQALGVKDHVKSPTYTLVESYSLPAFTVHHFDLYRLKESSELEWMGIQDYFVPKSICLIEWPEVGNAILPVSDITYMIEHAKCGRCLMIQSHSAVGEVILRRLEHEYS